MKPATPQERASERLHERLKDQIRTHERRPPPERKGYRYTGKEAEEAGRRGRGKTGYGKKWA